MIGPGEQEFQRGYFVSCACNPKTGSQCQHHARQPRPCSRGCGGHLNYQPEGRRAEVRVEGRRVGSRGVPSRHCNRCEYCE